MNRMGPRARASLPYGPTLGALWVVVLAPSCGRSDALRDTATPVTITADDMVTIPAGSYLAGSDHEAADEVPRRVETVAAFLLDRTEVTVGAYASCVAAKRCTDAHATVDGPDIPPVQYLREFLGGFCRRPTADSARYPVNCVDWFQATAYCAWAGKRLPTEVEWEYAARGPSALRFPWGQTPPDATRANVCGAECRRMAGRAGLDKAAMFDADDGFESLAPVGSFPQGRSPFGALDMAGNVWEWTSSGYSEKLGGPRNERYRVFRGGGWASHHVESVRAAVRHADVPESRGHDLGFRCAKSL